MKCYTTKLFVFSFCMVLAVVFSNGIVCSGAEKASASKGRPGAKDVPGIYMIGHGDVLEIATWKEPDLSRERVIVRIDGRITFPLLGDIQASGLTPMQLKYDMEAGLKKFVDNPIVTVTVQEAVSQRYYILGEVESAGEYPLLKGLTVLQALAIAEGFTEYADKSEIILFRHEKGKNRIIKVNYKKIIKGKDFSQNVFLKANDTIIVP
jgi:polysaccharide export outer membrane protein